MNLIMFVQPSKYYSLAAAYVKDKFNVCVLSATSDGEIKKESSASWFLEGDVNQREAIYALRDTSLFLGDAQRKEQQQLSPSLIYYPSLLVALHSADEPLVDQMDSEIILPPEKEAMYGARTSKEMKAMYLVDRLIQRSIMDGVVENFRYKNNVGDALVFNDKEIDVAQELKWKKLNHAYLNDGDSNALDELKRIAEDQVEIAYKLNLLYQGGDLQFLQFSLPHTEYLNIPEVVDHMKSVLLTKGCPAVDIKFPSDERSDYYFNVLRPYMESEIRLQREKIDFANENPEYFKLEKALDGLSDLEYARYESDPITYITSMGYDFPSVQKAVTAFYERFPQNS